MLRLILNLRCRVKLNSYLNSTHCSSANRTYCIVTAYLRMYSYIIAISALCYCIQAPIFDIDAKYTYDLIQIKIIKILNKTHWHIFLPLILLFWISIKYWGFGGIAGVKDSNVYLNTLQANIPAFLSCLSPESGNKCYKKFCQYIRF